MLTETEALWQSILRTPDDVALHMAFADSLMEQGHPEGEKLRICLGIADGSIPKQSHEVRAIYDYSDFIALFEIVTPIQFEWIDGLPKTCILNWAKYIKYAHMIVQKVPITNWLIEDCPITVQRRRSDESFQLLLVTDRRLLAFEVEQFQFTKYDEGLEFLSKGLYYFARRDTYEDSCSDDHKRLIRGLATAFPRVQNVPEFYGGEQAPPGERGRTGFRRR